MDNRDLTRRYSAPMSAFATSNARFLGGLCVVMGGMFMVPRELPKRLRRIRETSEEGGRWHTVDDKATPGYLRPRDAGVEQARDMPLQLGDDQRRADGARGLGDMGVERNDALMRIVRPDEEFVWPFMRGSGRWGHGGWAVGRGKPQDDNDRVVKQHRPSLTADTSTK